MPTKRRATGKRIAARKISAWLIPIIRARPSALAMPRSASTKLDCELVVKAVMLTRITKAKTGHSTASARQSRAAPPSARSGARDGFEQVTASRNMIAATIGNSRKLARQP